MLHIELNVGKRRFSRSEYRIDRLDKMGRRKRGFTGKPWNWDIHQEFAKYLADLMRDEFVAAIEDQRFANKWPPLSFNYLRYKRIHRLSLKTWEATGVLKDSIVSKKRLGYYYVGIDPNRRYRNGARVLDIASYLEYGTSRMPARPLFRPIFEDIRKNLDNYWMDFLELEDIDPEEVNSTFVSRIVDRFRGRGRNREDQVNESYFPTLRNNPYDMDQK